MSGCYLERIVLATDATLHRQAAAATARELRLWRAARLAWRWQTESHDKCLATPLPKRVLGWKEGEQPSAANRNQHQPNFPRRNFGVDGLHRSRPTSERVWLAEPGHWDREAPWRGGALGWRLR